MTMRFQVQEMARAERMVRDEQIQHELDTYNRLLPAPGELSATLFLELTSDEELRTWLPELVGIERSCQLRIGPSTNPDMRVPSIPEDEHESVLTRDDGDLGRALRAVPAPSRADRRLPGRAGPPGRRPPLVSRGRAGHRARRRHPRTSWPRTSPAADHGTGTDLPAPELGHPRRPRPSRSCPSPEGSAGVVGEVHSRLGRLDLEGQALLDVEVRPRSRRHCGSRSRSPRPPSARSRRRAG